MRQTVILAAVAIASAMVGQSFATERASDALISACVDPNGGVSIPPSGACQSGATSLSWSQQGPPGLPGPPGPATPASLPISVPAIHLAATPKLVSQRSGISTSVALAGDGTTHLLDGSVTVHVPAQTWTHKRVIVCDLSGPGSAPLDRQVRAIEAHGAPLTYDVHLTGEVEIGPKSFPGDAVLRCNVGSRLRPGESVPSYSHVLLTDTTLVTASAGVSATPKP
jgi:hypothetical protein